MIILLIFSYCDILVEAVGFEPQLFGTLCCCANHQTIRANCWLLVLQLYLSLLHLAV